MEPVLIDASVVSQVEALTELAPLHNAPAVEVIRAAGSALSETPHVACFDTAFHSTCPRRRGVIPSPGNGRTSGASVASASMVCRSIGRSESRANGTSSSPTLGSGCSVTAVRDGQSAWTSMGFTPARGPDDGHSLRID